MGGRRPTYGVALVAVACNLALAATKIDASVLVGIAPRDLLVRGHGAGGDGAARDGGAVGAVLGRGKASKSRGGDDKSRVEHGGCLGGYQCLGGEHS